MKLIEYATLKLDTRDNEPSRLERYDDVTVTFSGGFVIVEHADNVGVHAWPAHAIISMKGERKQ